MPVRRVHSRQEAWLEERRRMRLLYQATDDPQAGKWLQENDREWLEQYLVNQARLNRNHYYGPQRIGYY